MIIDCHGHYTTAPSAHNEWRETQVQAFLDGRAAPAYPTISDDEIRETIEQNQLKLLRERGSDMTIFSPRASAMAHHEGDLKVGIDWAYACNDLIARVVDLFPDTFIGVCQLPQFAGDPLDAALAELRRCVGMGFVGLNLNPDPSGGRWSSPPLTDRYWYPMYEAMVELDVPAMVHVSASCTPVFHATGAHYINADTTAFMQLIQGDLFKDFPTLRLVIPHGGGAAPYHWGRYRDRFAADGAGGWHFTERTVRVVERRAPEPRVHRGAMRRTQDEDRGGRGAGIIDGDLAALDRELRFDGERPS